MRNDDAGEEKRQIAATDKQDETLRRTQRDPRGRIDAVYELYGLTEDEIRIVEGERK